MKSSGYKKFFTYNLLGGILWTAGITYAGYYAGAILRSAGIDPDTIILPIIVFVVFISILPALYQVTKNKEIGTSLLPDGKGGQKLFETKISPNTEIKIPTELKKSVLIITIYSIESKVKYQSFKLLTY